MIWKKRDLDLEKLNLTYDHEDRNLDLVLKSIS